MSLGWFGRSARRFRQEAASFWGWWWHELREAAADLEQRVSPGRPQHTTVALYPNSGAVIRKWRDGKTESAGFQYTPSADLPADPAQFWPQAGTDRSNIRVILPPGTILLRRVWLPEEAERNLMQIIELQLERELPIPRAQVHADWRVEKHDRERERIEVLVAVVRRSEVTRLLDTLGQWNVRVGSIAADLGDGRTAFNFSPRKSKHAAGGLTPIERLLATGAVSLLVVLAGIVTTQWLHERMLVAQELLKTTAPTVRVKHMTAQFEKSRAPLTALQQVMDLPSSAVVLADLTTAVPRESWLQQLEIRNSEDGNCTVRFTAITPGATSLIERLAQSAQFRNVELHSSGASNLTAGHDRAEVSARWVRQPPQAGQL